MSRRRVTVACEEELAIDRLYDQELAARRGNEYDSLNNEVEQTLKSDKESAEKKQDSEDESTPPEGEDTTDASDEGEVTDSDPALEQFRELTYAPEGFGEFAQSAKEVVTLLGTLGIQYGGAALRHIYKSVVYVFAKLARLLYVSSYNLNKYIERRVNSFNNIKEGITDLRKSLEAIKAAGEEPDLTDLPYTRTKVINTLKIGNSVEFEANIETLSKFVENTVKRISDQILHETNAIEHIVAMSSGSGTQPPSKLMAINGHAIGLKEGTVQGFEPASEFVVPFRSSEVLPSDVVLIATLPKPDLTEFSEITRAYSDSSLILGIDSAWHKQVDSVEHMSLDNLNGFLDKLDALCDVCIAQQAVYDKIKRNRSTLKITVKNYFLRLTHQTNKVSLSNSFVEYVYLKAMFVDKVYLTSAIDIHDYAAKVLTTGLRFVKDHVTRMT